MLQQIDPYVGKYYSTEWIRKNVLRQSDEDIEEIDSQMDEDSANPSLNPPADIINTGGAQGAPNTPDINK
jgi:hypothetical protein